MSKLIEPQRLEEIVQRARDGGAEIVNYLKTGSAFYAPSASIVQMVEAIIFDKKEILPCTAYLKGEYGINDVCSGTVVQLGEGGIQKVFEMSLDPSEQERVTAAAVATQDLLDQLTI